MDEQTLPKVQGAGRVLVTIQEALNRLIADGKLTKKDIVDGINETFSPSDGTEARVAVDHPSEAHAILSEFVSGLRNDPKPDFQPTMEN